MTRFRSLEFDSHDEENKAEPQFSFERQSRDEQYYVQQADEQFQLARFEQALRYYSRALEFNPNFEIAWVGQVRMLIELGEFHEAGIWADKALDIFRDQPELLAAKAVVFVRMGQREKALEFSDAATRQPRPSPYVWLVRGEVLLATKGRNGDFCLDKAKTIAGRDWFIILLIARVYYFYRQYAKGLDFARQAMDLKATNPFVWLVLGNCQQALGLTRQAKESYQQALTLDAEFTMAREALDGMRAIGWLQRLFPSFFG